MQKIFYFITLPAVISIPTNGLILQLFYFNTILSDSELYLTNSSIIFFYVMTIICYIQSIRISNANSEICWKPRRVFVGSHYNHTLYLNNKTCAQQNKFKPSRTSHCHICGCQLRMDHHCPWINNCVGLRNHRAFLLFCTYAMLFTLHYDYRCIRFYSYVNNSHQEYSTFFMRYWTIFTVIAFLLTFSLVSLTISHLLLISRNTTTLDLMKGEIGFRTNPKKPNIFNIGSLANIAMFFQNDKFFFWLPKIRTTRNDGISYPVIPPVQAEQVNALPLRIQQELKSQEQKTLPKTFEELIQKNSHLYSQTIFDYMGKSYTIASLKKQEQKQDKQPQKNIKKLIQFEEITSVSD